MKRKLNDTRNNYFGFNYFICPVFIFALAVNGPVQPLKLNSRQPPLLYAKRQMLCASVRLVIRISFSKAFQYMNSTWCSSFAAAPQLTIRLPDCRDSSGPLVKTGGVASS